MYAVEIPVIEVEGSNYDIGLTIGQTLKKQIKRLIQLEAKEYQKIGKEFSNYAEKSKPLIGYVNKYFPKYVAELKGMAEGSGIDVNAMFALGCEDEFLYNCTSVAGFSKEGIILGHNEDWLKDFTDSLYICKMRDSISLSYAGHLPGFCAGLTSKKLAFTENALEFKNCNSKGIPLHFFTRAFLDAKKPSELIKLASMPNKMIGWNSLIVFGNKIFDLEFAPKGYALLKGNQYLAHTNHILDKNLKSQEREHSKDSSWRLEQANELLRNNKFDFNLVKKILADHKHRPFSICCHEYEKKGAIPYATLASVIINVRKNEFYVAHGNPCKAKYKKYEF